VRFGFESEKILFNTARERVFHGVHHLLNALSDLAREDDARRVEPEFVLNMVEIVSSASASLLDVAREYIRSYAVVEAIGARASAVMLPVGSYPLPFKPIMAPKWRYSVQNAILMGDVDAGFTLVRGRGLFDAANCAGVHVHAEITTLPEFLAFTRELADKHNLGVALVPLIALASSPYFRNRHRAHSMRAHRYYGHVYRGFRAHGGLPPLFRTSNEVLRHYHRGMQRWVDRGVALGFAPDEMRRLTERHGAHWGMLRWSRRLNTIELRCFDTDRVDLDLAKLALVAGAMRRLDVTGEALVVTPRSDLPIERAFTVENGAVCIPDGERLPLIVKAAIRHGLRDDVVAAYLARLVEFATRGIAPEESFLAEPAIDSIARRETTADRILANNEGATIIRRPDALAMLRRLHTEEGSALEALRSKLAAAPGRRW
jgi:gamma-glutamyl:cysteine ligase YbdK (ATP-grasp superfamily)